MNTQPFWSQASIPRFEKLQTDLHVDTLVIGGGITGVTTAHLLAVAGQRVALVERETIATRDTGHTTAHLTFMTDTRLSDLVARNGEKAARVAWQAGDAAMEYIRQTVETLGLDCEFDFVPGYLAAGTSNAIREERECLLEEAKLARRMGFDVTYLDRDPVNGLPALLFPGQMKFHPRKYLAGIVAEAVRNGAALYEHTEVSEFKEDHAIANGRRITCENLVMATHVPLQGESAAMGAALFQTKLALYSTYAVSASLPKGELEEMIWSDTEDPFHYLRIDHREGRDIAILGGEDHKTGQRTDTLKCFHRLEEKLSALHPDVELTHHWSGQVVETVDGLPFIGRTSERQFIATGFSGNGMTFGTAAALMARDAILGIPNPWTETFDPSRKSLGSLAAYVSENVDFPTRFVSDRMGIPDDSLSTIATSDGRVIDRGGEAVAAYRDSRGKLHLHSAVCPHLGCIVAWNEAELTWDCPCHGSRFRATGEVMAGPAEEALKPVSS